MKRITLVASVILSLVGVSCANAQCARHYRVSTLEELENTIETLTETHGSMSGCTRVWYSNGTVRDTCKFENGKKYCISYPAAAIQLERQRREASTDEGAAATDEGSSGSPSTPSDGPPKKVFELRDGTVVVGTVLDEGETGYLIRNLEGDTVRVVYGDVLRVSALSGG